VLPDSEADTPVIRTTKARFRIINVAVVTHYKRQNKRSNAKINYAIIMVAYAIGQTIIFYPVISIFYLLSFFPRLISAVGDWMSTILPHVVWP